MAELNALLNDEYKVSFPLQAAYDDTKERVAKRLEEQEACVDDADSWVLVDHGSSEE